MAKVHALAAYDRLERKRSIHFETKQKPILFYLVHFEFKITPPIFELSLN